LQLRLQIRLLRLPPPEKPIAARLTIRKRIEAASRVLILMFVCLFESQ
jgi:hypothetical protein